MEIFVTSSGVSFPCILPELRSLQRTYFYLLFTLSLCLSVDKNIYVHICTQTHICVCVEIPVYVCIYVSMYACLFSMYVPMFIRVRAILRENNIQVCKQIAYGKKPLFKGINPLDREPVSPLQRPRVTLSKSQNNNTPPKHVLR